MDAMSTLKSAIKNRDVRGVVQVFFSADRPELKSGFFREDQWWDYKEDCPSPSRAADVQWAKVAADVAAFYNQEGGVIFFGIRDRDFKFSGARPMIDTKLFNDKIRKYIGDRFWVSFSREFIQADQAYLGMALIPARSADHVRMLRDGPICDEKPIFRAGDLCVRVGDQTRILRGSEAITFSASKGMGLAGATFIVDEPNFRVLRPDYKQFIHREAVCAQIEKALQSGRTYVTSLTGIGGIGKTALACWTTLTAFEGKGFDFIVSVSAKDRALTSAGIVATSPNLSSLKGLLREICETTGFGEFAEIDSEEEQLTKVRDDILSQFRGLLFVDNLETVDDPRIVAFLEDLPIPTKVLVTSREGVQHSVGG
jgi:Schlafen, AlbA_2